MGKGMREEGGVREGRLSDCGEELGVKLLQVICTAHSTRQAAPASKVRVDVHLHNLRRMLLQEKNGM